MRKVGVVQRRWRWLLFRSAGGKSSESNSAVSHEVVFPVRRERAWREGELTLFAVRFNSSSRGLNEGLPLVCVCADVA
jgi:hypothetical protein